MIVDSRKQQREHPPIHIDGTVVERAVSFKFLGVHITDKLNWSTHSNFNRCTIESILSGCITAWYGNCSAPTTVRLFRV
jgi:hypothetical protein